MLSYGHNSNLIDPLDVFTTDSLTNGFKIYNQNA